MGSSSGQSSSYDFAFKILLIGDAGVGKSSLFVGFTSEGPVGDLPHTIGVDFKVRYITVDGNRLKLTLWDTAGQERYRTLTSSYYKGAHGIVLVYDITRKDTFKSLSDFWIKEVDIYSTPDQKCAKILVGNKIDRESERAVSIEEGKNLAKEHGFLFTETCAKTRQNVEKCFEELALKIIKDSGVQKKVDPPAEPPKKQEYAAPPSGGGGGGGGCCHIM